MTDRDPLELLRDALRNEPIDLLPDDRVAAIVQLAMSTPPTDKSLAKSRRRRRRWFVGVGIGIGLTAGGGLAAAVLNKGRVSHPEAGVGCRATVDPKSDVYVISDFGDDPIGECAALWAERVLPNRDPEQNSGVVPELAACLNEHGTVDIVPVDDGVTCDSLGRVSADMDALVVDPVTILTGRVSDIPACSTPQEVEALIHQFLDDLDLSDWKVEIRPGDGPCAQQGIDPETNTVFIVPAFPPGVKPTEGTS